MVSNFQASSSSWSFIFYTLHASQGCHNWITLNLRKWLATAALVVSRGGIVTSQVLISDGQQLEKNRCAVGALGLGDCMSSCHSSCETTKVSTNRIFGALQHPVKPSNAIRSSSYVSTYMIPNCHIVSHVSLCLPMSPFLSLHPARRCLERCCHHLWELQRSVSTAFFCESRNL